MRECNSNSSSFTISLRNLGISDGYDNAPDLGQTFHIILGIHDSNIQLNQDMFFEFDVIRVGAFYRCTPLIAFTGNVNNIGLNINVSVTTGTGSSPNTQSRGVLTVSYVRNSQPFAVKCSTWSVSYRPNTIPDILSTTRY